MKRREVDSTKEAAARMAVLRGSIRGKRSALDSIESPWNRQRIQSDIGEMEERLEELEREWPTAAQRIS